jgi:hypothetical protein
VFTFWRTLLVVVLCCVAEAQQVRPLAVGQAHSGFEFESIPGNAITTIPPQGCTVTQFTPTTATAIPATSTILDAGEVTISGPSGSGLSNMQIPEASNVYSLGMAGQENFVAGAYTLSGSGGVGVGPFTATLNLGAPLTITGGLPSTVTRSAGLTINWTGGNSSDLVEVIGSAGTLVNGNEVSGAEFTCITTAGAGGITVPSSILNQLPAISAAQVAANTAEGSLAVDLATIGSGLFSAPLAAGGSINATFVGEEDAIGSAVYQ